MDSLDTHNKAMNLAENSNGQPGRANRARPLWRRYMTLWILAVFALPNVVRASCIPTDPDPVDLLVESCSTTPDGHAMIRGRARLAQESIESHTKHSDRVYVSWDTLPFEDFVDPYIDCSVINFKESVLAYRYKKCCDVEIIDTLTGEVSRPCDNEPWQIRVQN